MTLHGLEAVKHIYYTQRRKTTEQNKRDFFICFAVRQTFENTNLPSRQYVQYGDTSMIDEKEFDVTQRCINSTQSLYVHY